MTEHPAADGVILKHALWTALTPLIPVPFVDGAAQNYVMRKMVRSLAELHHLRLWEPEVKVLADDEGGKLLVGLAKGAVLAPFKFFLRKTFMVLAGKRIVDLASRSYHHGFLLERAFARGFCAPAGRASPQALRRAIDEVLRAAPVATSPVTHALRRGLQSSQRGLADAYAALRARLVAGAGEADLEDAVRDEGGIAGVVAAVQHALGDVPREHFEDLERALERRLFGDAHAADIIVKETESP